MFKNAYQSGLLSIFYSCGSKPLELWDVQVKNGHIKRLTDSDVRSIVLEIGGSNVSTTFITCPKGGKALGITLPYMVMIVKNLKKHFTFEVTVVDQTFARRRFRISNFQSCTQILPLCTTMPITLNDGWNQIQFNLAEFTKRSYKTQFMEVTKLKINANIRLRRVYFTEALLPDDQLPPEYKLYIPLVSTKLTKAKAIVEEAKGKENVMPSPSTLTAIKTNERKGSKVDFAKTSSKVSISTTKKPSDQVIKPKTEGEKPPETVPVDEKLDPDLNKPEVPLESKRPSPTELTETTAIEIEDDKALIVVPAEPVPEGESPAVEVVPTESTPVEATVEAPVESLEEPVVTTENVE